MAPDEPLGPPSIVSATEIQVPPGPTIGQSINVVQRDLDQNGSHEAGLMRDMLTIQQSKRNGFFYCRRMVEIIDSLGSRFGLSPGSHTQKVVYDVPTGRAMGTEDLIEWARRHGWTISSNTVNNYRTLWIRAQKARIVVEREHEKITMEESFLDDGPEKVEKVLRLQDLDRMSELFKVLVEGVDIEATGTNLRFVTAAEVWRMKQREWLALIEPWAPIQRRRGD